MLVYQKHKKQTIKLIVENQKQQGQNLKEQTDSINTSKTSTTQAQSQTLDRADPTVTREKNQDQQSPPAAPPPPPVPQSTELAPGYVSTKYDEQKQEYYKDLPFNSVTKYVPHHLYKAVWDDNNQFLFEKQIYANEYFSFLRDVLIAVRDQIKKPDTPQDIRQSLSQDMVTIGSKMVLQVLSRAYSNDPITKISQVLLEIYQQNESSARKFLSQLLLDEGIMFTKLMFGCPDKGVRECVAKLTSTCLNLIFKQELDVLYETVQLFDKSSLEQQSAGESERKEKRSLGTLSKALSVRFLDFMQGLVRGDCHKNWTRFDQFFSIYRQFVMGGQEQLQFMFKRELISALIDFMLGNSSPLKVPGQKRSLMGSRFTIPCFDPIIDTVSYMALHSYTDSFYKRKIIGTDNKNEPIYQKQQQLAHNKKAFKGDYNNAHELTLNELICLRSPALVEKSLKQNHGPQSISKFIAHFSYNNYEYSHLIAKIILNGVNQADYQQIVPYLESISEFLLISDSFRFHRLEWLLGISLPSTGKLNIQISRFGLSMLDSGMDQVTNYYSPLMYDSTNDSILTLLWRYHKKWDTYAMRCLNTLLSLMLESEDIFDWIFNAAPPIIQYSRYSDWFVQFNQNYIQDLKRYQSAYSTKREELAENSKRMLEEINQKIANRVQQNRKNYKGQQIKPLRMTYTEQTDDKKEKKIEQEIRFIENFPPNYVISDTIEQKILRKISNHGIDVRIYEIYTNVYYSRPNGVSSTVVSEEYFRVKKQKKEIENKHKIANRQPIQNEQNNIIKTVEYVKQSGKDQKIDLDTSPLGQISDDQAQVVPAKELKKGTSDTDSGENIMKLTKVKEESVEPNISVVQPQTQPKSIIDISDNTADVELNEYNYIHDNPFVTSSVLKFTVHNTTDKPLQSNLRIFPAEGKTANFYIPICDLRNKIKPNSLRVAAFFQKKDINEVWGDFQIQIQAHQIETGNRSFSKAIGPVDQLKYTNQTNLNIGVSGDLDGMDQNYDIENQANYFINQDDHLNNTDSDSQYLIDNGRIEKRPFETDQSLRYFD